MRLTSCQPLSSTNVHMPVTSTQTHLALHVFSRFCLAYCFIASVATTHLFTAEVAAESVSLPPALISQIDEACAGQPTAIQQILYSLTKADTQETLAILKRIRSSGDVRGSSIALSLIPHHDHAVGINAIDVIAKLGVNTVALRDALLAQLDSPTPLCRPAIIAIDTWWDDRALPRLIALLNTPDQSTSSAALDVLRKHSGLKTSADLVEWRRWYNDTLSKNSVALNEITRDLQSQKADVIITALQTLPTLLTMHDRATALAASFVQHSDLLIRQAAEKNLRILTHTPSERPIAVALERSQSALAAFPSLTIENLLTVHDTPSIGLITPTRPFLDTWLGLCSIITAALSGLSITIYLLRTPVGVAASMAVKGATMRIARKTGAAHVAVVVGENTMRLMKPMMKPIKQLTKRISKNTKRMARKAELGTRRLARPAKKHITASSDEHQALQRKVM